MYITENNCVIHYIEIYLVDKVIHLLNNCSWVDTGLSTLFLNDWGQENNGSVNSKCAHPLPRHLLCIGHLAVPVVGICQKTSDWGWGICQFF